MDNHPASDRAQKADVYASFGNSALLRMVEQHLPDGGSVLDVGCASGGLLAALGDRAGRSEGIEVDPAAAARAEQFADAVHVGPIEDLDLPAETFDVVVLGDVLEHLVDPATVLARIRTLLVTGGCIVVSLPNVGHWTIRWELLRGRWEYRSTGILDDTHLRFFTWESGSQLLQASGYQIVDRKPIVPSLSAHLDRRLPSIVDRVWSAVGWRRPGLFAFQQLIVARPEQ